MPDPTPPSPTQHPAEWAERAAAASTATGHTVGCTCSGCERLRDPGQAVDLDGVRRRVEAATPGPWTAHNDGLVWPERMGDPVSGSTELADAEFIAHARTGVPALLADLDAARAKLNAVCDILTATQAERDEVARDLGSEALRWRAERDRMRPVVEAARALVAAQTPGRHEHPNYFSGDEKALFAAVDTYETQTGGTDGL